MRLPLMLAAASFLAAATLAQAGDIDTNAMQAEATASQPFYPVGHSADGGLVIDFYVLGGPLSETKATKIRGAVLANVTASPDGPAQMVEIEQIDCGTKAFRPTYRIWYDPKGAVTEATGPVVAGQDFSLLTPEAIRATVQVLCGGAPPANALSARTLADFRAHD